MNNLIAILDNPDCIRKKIQRAVTDSSTEIIIDKSRPGISNLINLYALISDMSTIEVEKRFEGKMYSDFKLELGDLMVEYLQPIQYRYEKIVQDKAYLKSILKRGAENAYHRARKTLTKVYRKVGFIPNIIG